MRIGIFGGSFNPPHNMHLEIGKKLVLRNYLDKVIYLPTGNKYPKSGLLRDQERYQMVKDMTEEYSYLEVSDYELKKHLVYTYQTLEYFKKIYPKNEIYFILGTDLYKQFLTWRNYQRILENFPILIILRNGDSICEIENLYPDIKKNIIITDIYSLNVSSTMIREDIKNHNFDKLKEILPEKVLEDIKNNHYYEE